MDEKLMQQVKDFVTKIVTDLGFSAESITVTGEEKEERIDLQVIVKGDELELLIGYHGKNLESLHQITVGCVKQIFPKDKRVSLFLDVGDYFEKQNEKLRQLVAEAVEEVKLLDEPYEFKPMAPRMRRIVHLEVEKHPEIRTESTGEGMDRRVIIYPSNANQPTNS
jgi:spoIIIJ-associated protein